MSRFLNSCYSTLEAYVPGEQPKDKRYIKLNTNESPFPPSPSVLEAIEQHTVEDLRLYCDPTCAALRERLAQSYGASPANVYVANGSDDILNFAFAAFGETGVMYPQISYGFYPVFAQLYGMPSREMPLLSDFSIDVSQYRGRGRLIVIANPNAPTGLLLSVDEIRSILTANPDSVVVIDEAYIDFGGDSCLPLIHEFDNLLVVRTYSKSRSLAGARLGFAFGAAPLIEDLEKLKYSTNPYNVNTLTQLLGIAALADSDYYERCCRSIIEAREYTVTRLLDMGFYVTDSYANFVFASSPRISGEGLYTALRSRGILVRHFSAPAIADFNRISVGTMSDMQILTKTIREILEDTKFETKDLGC